MNSAELGEENIIGMNSYPDEITYKLVGSGKPKIGITK